MVPAPRQIFLVFLKIGTFAIGGVYSMLSFYQRELVERRRWLTHEEFAEGVAIGQMTPGPPIVNTGIYVGYRLGGIRGALAATAGQVLPGLVLVLVLGYLYFRYRQAPILGSALKGVAAAVVGLLLSIVYRMGREIIRRWPDLAFSAGAFAALLFFRVNPIALIVISGFLGYLAYGRAKG